MRLEFAKFLGSRVIVGPAGLVPSYNRAFVGRDVGTTRKNTLRKNFWTLKIPSRARWYDGTKPTDL